jgi:hypothetical protein
MTSWGSISATPASRRSARHPLLGPFPMAVMTLATFLVIFTLMMARLNVGADPALRGAANPVALTAGSGAGAVTTRASGASAAASSTVQAAAGQGTATATPAVVTRTSGAAGARIGDD